MVGMRDSLIHQCQGVSAQVLYATATREVDSVIDRTAAWDHRRGSIAVHSGDPICMPDPLVRRTFAARASAWQAPAQRPPDMLAPLDRDRGGAAPSRIRSRSLPSGLR